MSDKSFIANIGEKILRFTKPDYMDSKVKVDDFLNEKSNSSVNLPGTFFKSVDFNGTQVFTIGNKNAKNTILYIHGGAYVNELNYQHLLYCFMLSRKVDAYVIVPVYPLAPLNNARKLLS